MQKKTFETGKVYRCISNSPHLYRHIEIGDQLVCSSVLPSASVYGLVVELVKINADWLYVSQQDRVHFEEL